MALLRYIARVMNCIIEYRELDFIMKKLFLLLLLVLIISGCFEQNNSAVEPSANNDDLVQKGEDYEQDEEQKEEPTFDDYKQIVAECFNVYYQTTMDAQIMTEEKSFYLWNPIYADGSGRYATPATVLQFKKKPNEIYNGTANKLIWKDGAPVEGQFEIGGGPMTLTVINGPINIRKEHSSDSETIRLAENGEEYLAFENYDDGEYIWYRVYDSQKDTFAWIASDKNNPWVGVAI